MTDTAFIFMGDPQCSRLGKREYDYSRWQQLLQMAFRRAYGSADRSFLMGKGQALLVLGGDLISRGGDQAEWEAFCRAMDGAWPGGRVLLVPGNSDYRRFEEAAAAFGLPGNGPAGYEHHFGSIDYGCVHFLLLDSNLMGCRSPEGVHFLMDWIRRDLQASRQPVTVAVMHHPLFPAVNSLDDEVRGAFMRKHYLPLFSEYGVDMVLCGHQHLYCRTKAMPARPVQLMGVSGSKHHSAGKAPHMAAVRADTSVATVFFTDGETIRMETIDREGDAVDAWSTPAKEKPAGKRGEGASAPTEEPAGYTVRAAAAGAQEGDGSTAMKPSADRRSFRADPLRPDRDRGLLIRISGRERRCLSMKELEQISLMKEIFSVMRRGGLRQEEWTGLPLREILRAAGWNPGQAGEGAILLLTTGEGLTAAVSLDDVLTGMRFDPAGACFGEQYPGSGEGTMAGTGSPAEPLLVPEEGEGERKEYRLVFGQQYPEEYNGRGWARDVVSLEITGKGQYG